LNHTGASFIAVYSSSSWLCTTYAKKNGAIRRGKKWQQRPQAVFSKKKRKKKKEHTTPQAVVNAIKTQSTAITKSSGTDLLRAQVKPNKQTDKKSCS